MLNAIIKEIIKMRAGLLLLTILLISGCKNLFLYNKPVQQAILDKANGCAVDSNSVCLLINPALI